MGGFGGGGAIAAGPTMPGNIVSLSEGCGESGAGGGGAGRGKAGGALGSGAFGPELEALPTTPPVAFFALAWPAS